MDKSMVAFSVTTFLRQLRERVERAQGIAEAADACARVGQIARAVELANDTDELIHDAEQLLGMATSIVRFSRRGDAGQSAAVAPASEPSADAPVDASLAAETVRTFLHQARQRLDKAVSIATAAEICAAVGKPDEGARFALDVEPLLYEAKNFINTASIVNRLAHAGPVGPPG